MKWVFIHKATMMLLIMTRFLDVIVIDDLYLETVIQVR